MSFIKWNTINYYMIQPYQSILTRKWIDINYLLNGQYSLNNNMMFKSLQNYYRDKTDGVDLIICEEELDSPGTEVCVLIILCIDKTVHKTP